MRNRISFAVFLLLAHLSSWAQIGGDYNPNNPSDPGNPTQEYTLTLKASPSIGGSFNTTSTNIAGGKTYNLRAYPSTDFAFVAWICNGDTLSKSSSYTYTMPYHDVQITGAFIYSPSNPSDPQEQAQKYTLKLKAIPTEGGSFNTSSSRVSVGERFNLRAYPNTDFAFVAWLCDGDTLSKVASYDYTMPSHNVDITGVFTYCPSSPSDPQEQALKYQLSLVAEPMNSGSFNISNERLAVGSNNSLRAYSNTDFVFRCWTIGDSVLSTNPNMDFVMPSHNVQIIGHFEYNPASPANPNKNYWNKLTGEVIVDDFIPGNLASAISSVISGSSSNDVQMIIVSGRINSNDFGIANNYKNCSLLDLSRITGVTEVPSYAFDYTNLETVSLPSTIEKIGARAFADCTKLSSITVYAMTPPTLESGVFQGVPEGLVVYVPAAAIAQYQDIEAWGKYTLLPIQEDIRSISISLPEGTNTQNYAKMWLELTNTKSGQRMHYIMTDRETYTFANIIRNTSWNVTLRNERGDVFGRIDNVEVQDEDVTVTFASLSKPQNVSLAVLTPDGKDVTNQVQVTWTDAQGNYVSQGASLSGLPVGYQVHYQMVLSKELAMTYKTPAAAEYTLQDGNNIIACQLEGIRQVQLSGKVKDATTGQPMSGAVVSASQTFGGKYSKTSNAKTDNKGEFTLTIAAVPTTLAVAATDYVSQTVDLSNHELDNLQELAVPDVSLKSITGATITVGFTYTTIEGETQNWYSDYQNVSYVLYNVTKNRAISQFNVQYPQIVLLEEVDDGDVLRLTATSRTTNYTNGTNVGSFMPVTTTATIAEQAATATFDITELGRIHASFTTTGNSSVVGSLYDSTGKLIRTYNYLDSALTISDLADGRYTLVSMGSSRLFNTIYDLAQLPQTGLTEGSDYVKNSVEVTSGAVSLINISDVPTLDESKLYHTGDNTSFTVNKPSIVAGSYLTLTGRIDFKPEYATTVSNVQMIVDLPESCEFVENSVMVGNSISSYTLNGCQITIPMARYTDRVRFCIIPTLGGEYDPSAFAQFDLDGETVTQPIGSANYIVKDLSISVPSTVAKTSVPISGTAIGASNVEIYDNGVMIGQTTSLANGTWTTICELNEPYNLSKHQLYAKVTTKQGIELTSENVTCVYDMNAIQVSVVKMYHDNPEMQKTYELTFDFLTPSDKEESYIYYIYNKKFTFTIEFTINDTTKVSNVVLYVKTAKSGWHPLEATYDAKQDKWVAVGEFGNMYDGDLPVNVSVDYQVKSDLVGDRNKCQNIYNEISSMLKEDTELNALFVELQDAIDNHENILIESLSNTIEQRLGIFLSEEQEGLIKDLTDDDMNRIEEFFDSLESFREWAKIDNQCVFINEDGIQYVAEKKLWSETGITMSDLSSYYSCLLNDNSHIYFFSDEKKSIIVDPTYDLVLQLLISYASLSKPAPKHALNLQNLESFVNYWSGKYGEFQERVGPILEGIKTLQNLIDLKIVETMDRIQQLEDFAILYERGQYWNMPKTQGYYRSKGLKARAENTLKDLKYASKIVSKFLRVFDVAEMLNDFVKTISSVKEWIEIIRTIESIDCPGMDALAMKAQGYANSVAFGYATKLGTDIGALATADKLSKSGVGLVITAGMNDFAIIQGGLNEWNDIRWKADIRLQIPNVKCDYSIPYSMQSVSPYLGLDKKFGIDPSGYVYEGVFSNRVEGATATVYYKEMVEDMYGDLHENIVKWDAEEYAQENPLFTDEYGYYRWDVPQGLWQVKFEKEGYETTYSEWLPVPPPQLDVNIAMKQNVQPNVKVVRAYEDAVEVEFDKYMIQDFLSTDNIVVMQGGETVEGSIELLNEEAAYEGNSETFASKVRFNAAQPFAADEVTFLVSNRVKSYSGIRMQEDYLQTFTIEQEVREIACDESMIVPYGGHATIEVTVLPAFAAKGKRLTARTPSSMILSVEDDEATIGEDGKVQFTLCGELPGMSTLTYSIDGLDLTATTMISVEDVQVVEKPVPSVKSGQMVLRGTKLTLTSATEGATIYYTTDGSCPCSTATRIEYTEPIELTEDMTIKAIAVKDGSYDSDIVTLSYTISPTEYLPGDANGDGEVNSTDAQLVINYYLGKDVTLNFAAADVVGNGELNSVDAQAILNIYLNSTQSQQKFPRRTEKRQTKK